MQQFAQVNRIREALTSVRRCGSSFAPSIAFWPSRQGPFSFALRTLIPLLLVSTQQRELKGSLLACSEQKLPRSSLAHAFRGS